MNGGPANVSQVRRQGHGLRVSLLTFGVALTACGAGGDPHIGKATSQLRAQSLTWNASSLRVVDNPAGQYYTYAPSVIVDGATEHIWSCHNKDSGIVKDYIYYTKRVNGVVTSSVPVLSPSASGWDSQHVCDPSVLRSNVTYNGTAYSYVMFYLGTDSPNWHNQIGVAVAQNIAGPWIKYPSPIVADPFSDTSYWGVGQPSATSVDGNGRILLFYSQGDTNGKGFRRDINIGNLNSPSVGAAMEVTNAGLYRSDGFTGQFTSFDVAYDPGRDRFYAVLEQYPFSSAAPNFITSNLQLVSIDGSSIWNGGGSWRYEGTITPALTGFPRNHNAGFKRTGSGTLPNANRADIVFATSCAQDNGASCDATPWNYDLWEISGALDNAAAPHPTTSGYYTITNRLSGKALDVPYETVGADGTQIQQYALNGYQQQQWQFTDLGSGFFKITNRLSGKALDLPSASAMNNGALLQQDSYTGGLQQQWKVEASSSDFKITNRLSGKVLDLPYETYQNDGSHIQQWDGSDPGTPQQQWKIQAAP